MNAQNMDGCDCLSRKHTELDQYNRSTDNDGDDNNNVVVVDDDDVCMISRVPY